MMKILIASMLVLIPIVPMIVAILFVAQDRYVSESKVWGLWLLTVFLAALSLNYGGTILDSVPYSPQNYSLSNNYSTSSGGHQNGNL